MELRFHACQVVEISVAEQPVPIQHYLRQPRRVVNALAHSSQIEALGGDLYRLKMRPISFMMLSLQPIVDMRVWAEPDGTIEIRSTGCEIRGFQYVNQRFALDLVGKLQPVSNPSQTLLKGRADLAVAVEIPPAMRLTPRAFLETTGNSLLKSVLLTIKQRLMHHLLTDYYTWVADNPPVQSATNGLITSNNPIA